MINNTAELLAEFPGDQLSPETLRAISINDEVGEIWSNGTFLDKLGNIWFDADLGNFRNFITRESLEISLFGRERNLVNKAGQNYIKGPLFLEIMESLERSENLNGKATACRQTCELIPGSAQYMETTSSSEAIQFRKDVQQLTDLLDLQTLDLLLLLIAQRDRKI